MTSPTVQEPSVAYCAKVAVPEEKRERPDPAFFDTEMVEARERYENERVMPITPQDKDMQQYYAAIEDYVVKLVGPKSNYAKLPGYVWEALIEDAEAKNLAFSQEALRRHFPDRLEPPTAEELGLDVQRGQKRPPDAMQDAIYESAAQPPQTPFMEVIEEEVEEKRDDDDEDVSMST